METESQWKRLTAIFLVSQTLSFFGTSLVQYALMWTVTLQTQSGIWMTVYILCGFVPTFLLSPFGGVWADRYNRKTLMILADGGIAVATLVLAIVVLAGGQALWLIMVLAALRALGSAVHGPAAGAILPQFVPADKLTRVNGIFSGIQSGIMFLSPILSGVLMSVMPLGYLFFVDVVTAAIAIFVLLVFLKVPPHQKAAETQKVSYFEDMKLGFRYIRSHRYLVPFFSFVAVILLMVAPAAFLTPLQVARSFGAEVWRLTAIEIVFSIGMMIGGGIIAAWGGFKNRVYTMFFAVSVMAACTVLLGLTPNFWIYLIPMGVFGLALPFYNTGATVLIQEHVEESYMGRVFSVLNMLMTSMMPLGMLVFGPLAEVVSIETLLIITGAAMLLISVFILFNKPLREAGMPPVKPADPAEPGAAAGGAVPVAEKHDD